MTVAVHASRVSLLGSGSALRPPNTEPNLNTNRELRTKKGETAGTRHAFSGRSEECMRCRPAAISVSALLVILFAAAGAAAADDDIRLAGCLVRGQDGKGYLLTNLPGEVAWQRPGGATVVPGPVGTSGTVASVLYWLEKHDGLEDHVGHYVEIEGKSQGDLKDGQLKVTPKGDWTEVEVEADGRSLKARVPGSVLIVPDNDDRKLDVLVRRVEAQRVRMLAAVCGR
jgi:hypothetical protein